MKTAIVFIVPILLFMGCSKNPAAQKDTELPVITINTPLNGQIFSAGQSILISGTITDNEYIAEVHIHVNNNNTGELLMDVHLYPGTNTTTFSQPITAVAGVNYKIQLLAKDREANEAINTVNVSCN